jgi:hypothetical protein
MTSCVEFVSLFETVPNYRQISCFTDEDTLVPLGALFQAQVGEYMI